MFAKLFCTNLFYVVILVQQGGSMLYSYSRVGQCFVKTLIYWCMCSGYVRQVYNYLFLFLFSQPRGCRKSWTKSALFQDAKNNPIKKIVIFRNSSKYYIYYITVQKLVFKQVLFCQFKFVKCSVGNSLFGSFALSLKIAHIEAHL